MARTDLSEAQLEGLVRWARGLTETDRGDQVAAVVAEVKRLRENESNTRFLMEIDGEV